jgi:hypothetical protein
MTYLLPHYANILDTAKVHVSEAFRTSLTGLYRDLFGFFQAVARVFTQKNGSE